MEELKAYLKSLPDEPACEQFAARCGTTLGHMRNTLYDPKKRLKPAVCVAVERESSNAVRRWNLRPADWHLIWPELRSRKGAPPVSVTEEA
jgi:DNA-binding transcriptional regulator YdaS (Cro superfamily)